ncbi:hypothetical protein BOTCAL_0910g00010 [Botryotinia calthae]|uniref:Uncharacterized protein n=1 Tax=Botryotinia calthae TaxID=38488 RepID=A0A4Y8CF22_9HELO|nr:hypothetical protein BOTCAL_0910g00010 [Botryotinia calthae]
MTTAITATASAKGDDNNRSIYKAITDQFYKEDGKRCVILKIASAIDACIKSLNTTELSFANELKAKAFTTGTKANGMGASRTYTEAFKAGRMP